MPIPLHKHKTGSRASMPPKEKSPVWNYFDVVESRAQCRICSMFLTTAIEEFRCANLERHLRTHRGSEQVKQFELEKAAWKARQPGGDTPVVRSKRQPRLNKPIGSAEERKDRRRTSNREAQQRRRAQLYGAMEIHDAERGLSSSGMDSDSDIFENEAEDILSSSNDDKDSSMVDSEVGEKPVDIGINLKFVDKLAVDPIVSRLIKDHMLQAVLAKGATSSDTSAGQDLRDLVFADADHPFYNIRWELAMDHLDIIDLRWTYRKEELSDRVILFYLTYIAALAGWKRSTRTVAVVSPRFTAFSRPIGETSAYDTMTGVRSDFRYMLIPIRRSQIWALAIYDADLGKHPNVTYFDPLQRPLTTEVRETIESVLVTATEGDPLYASIVDADPLTFTRRTNGLYSGVYICMLAEQFVLHHRQVFLSDLDINGFRSKMLAVCTFLRGAALLARPLVDQQRCERMHARFQAAGATTSDDSTELRSMLLMQTEDQGLPFVSSLKFLTWAVPYSLEITIVWTQRKHLLHASLTSKEELRLSSPDVRLLLSREFQNIGQIISAADELNLLEPSELVLSIVAEQDCFGLHSIGQVLASLQKQFPDSKVEVRIKFSESQDRFLRQEDWRALRKFDWIHCFKVFFHDFNEDNDECSEEAVAELERYCSYGRVKSPDYVVIFHASVNLTLEVIQTFSWKCGEVEKSRWDTTIAVQHCKSTTWILDYAKCRHDFREMYFIISSIRKFTSSRSHLSIYLLMDESDEEGTVKIILTTIPEDMKFNKNLFCLDLQRYSKYT